MIAIDIIIFRHMPDIINPVDCTAAIIPSDIGHTVFIADLIAYIGTCKGFASHFQTLHSLIFR